MYFVEIACFSSLFKANVGPMLRSKDHELYSMCIIFVRITVTKLEGEVYIIQLENGKGGVGLGPVLMIVRFGRNTITIVKLHEWVYTLQKCKRAVER